MISVCGLKEERRDCLLLEVTGPRAVLGCSRTYEAVHEWWYQYPGGNLHGILCSTAGSTEDAVVLPG